MSEIDQQFIEYVVKSLVGNPEAVHIDRRIDEKGVLLELTVDPEDLGRVIGKRGATAQSMRTLLRALGTKNDARYNLKIIDNGVGGGENEDARPAKSDSTSDSSDDSSAKPAEPVEPAKDDSSNDDATTDEPSISEEETPKEVPEEPKEAAPEEGTSDRLAQARRELADLDDLDV